MSENERLRKELEALVYALDFEDLSDSVDLNGAKSALAAMPETCVWNSREDYTYTRSCDGRHTALMPGSYLDGSDFQTDELCPGCGRKIEVTKWQAVKRHFEWRS